MIIKRLKDLREDKDLTQNDIAKLLNITRQQYGLYENGNRDIRLNQLVTLALFYDTSIDYLLELTNQNLPYPRAKLGHKK